MAPPHFHGWRQILRPANFVDVAQEAIETGLSSTLPPAVRHTGYHSNYFLLGFRATPSIPTSNRSSSRFSFKGIQRRRTGPLQVGLQGPPASGFQKAQGLISFRGIQGPPPTASSSLQFWSGFSRPWECSGPLADIREEPGGVKVQV